MSEFGDGTKTMWDLFKVAVVFALCVVATIGVLAWRGCRQASVDAPSRDAPRVQGR